MTEEQQNHELAIRALTECSTYGTYKTAVDKMLPLYKAAPELLGALKAVQSDFYHFDRATGGTLNRVESAIAKARGKS